MFDPSSWSILFPKIIKKVPDPSALRPDTFDQGEPDPSGLKSDASARTFHLYASGYRPDTSGVIILSVHLDFPLFGKK